MKLPTCDQTMTGHHPHTAGQLERNNRFVEDYHRHFVNYQQDNWANLLPTAEFVFNNHISFATKETPFMMVYGYTPSFLFPQ